MYIIQKAICQVSEIFYLDSEEMSLAFFGKCWVNSQNITVLLFEKVKYNVKYNNLDSILKSREISLPTKVRIVKAMVFPVVKYGCESWTIKKAER